MKKRFLVLAMALCMAFALGLAYADDTTTEETPVIDHATCEAEGLWEAVRDEEDYVPATCEADGLDRWHCNICGVYVKEDVLPKLGGHKVEVDAAVEPTCTETGLTEGKSCHNMITLADGTTVKCDYVEVAQEEVPAKGHGEAVPADPNWRPENFDCEKGFSTPAKCSICGDELKIDIHVTFEHQPEVMKAIEPTCELKGLTEGSKCKVCSKILVVQKKVDALGHDWKPVVGTAGSCTEDAVSYHYECERCGEKKDYTVLPAPGHKEETLKAVAPTCTETGLTAGKKCTVCGEITVKQIEVPALGHNWETILGTAATCEETGIAAHRQCKRCKLVEFDGKELEGQAAIDAVIIPAHGHVDEAGWENTPAVGKPAQPRPAQPDLLVETNPELNKDATCTEDGYKSGWHCPWCEEERKEAQVLPAFGHDWKITNTGKVPTCTEEGVSDEWSCEYCGSVKGNEPIKPLGHALKVVPAKLATCTTAGNYEYAYCDRVGCTYAEVTELDVGIMTNIGEIKVEKNAQNKVKGHPAEVVIPAFNHGFAAGVKDYVYGVSSVVEKINPVAPTCYKTGLGEGGLFCTLCQKVIKEAPALDMIPHKGICVPAKDATCIADGNLEFWYCLNEGCTAGYIIVDGVDGDKLDIVKTEDNKLEAYPEAVVLPKLGHDPKPGTPKAPTCTEAGWTEGSYCDRCGITLEEQEEIPATGHTKETIPAKAPTCTETGLTEGVKCSVCDEILEEQKPVKATGHIYDEYTPEIPATCYSVGWTEGLRCGVCDPAPDYGSNEGWLIFPQEIAKKPHAMKYAANLDKDPTCLEVGYDNYNYCTNKGCTHVVGEIIPALGHDWIEFDEQKPTCTEYGVISARTCRRCDITLPQEQVAPLGHNVVEIPAVAPTCTEDGATAGEKCDRCEVILKAPETVKATGHDMVHVDFQAPTCTEEGHKEGQECANGCGHKIGCEPLAKLEHTLGDWVVEIKPTYGPEGQGLKVKYCTTCGHKIEMDDIPALQGGRRGDVNSDGAVDLFDVLSFLQWQSGIISSINEDAADYNEDGVVDLFDAYALLYAV